MKRKISLLLFVLFATFAAKASNPPGDGNNKKMDLMGGVVHAESKKPLGQVSVSAYMSNKKEKVVFTDHRGNFSFDELKPGTYKLIFEKDGFQKAVRDKVVIRGDEGCQLNVELDEESTFQLLLGGLLFTDVE